MLTLTEMQLDALTEIVNIGVGRAANSLSDIIGEHIHLKVPGVEIFSLDKLPQVLSTFDQVKHSSVLQAFQGDFTGTSALVFPPESAVRLVTVLTDSETDSPSLDAVSSGTLIEIGNIVINAILGTMGNMLESNFIFSLPEYREIKNIKEILASNDSVNDLKKKEGFIMLAEANFNISSLEIQGFIFILFKLDSVKTLITMLDRSIEGSL
ncbi:MAG: chemotaxis protein CheC [bacterium]|nr:chemotaxis protein CheC [bacterium]